MIDPHVLEEILTVQGIYRMPLDSIEMDSRSTPLSSPGAREERIFVPIFSNNGGEVKFKHIANYFWTDGQISVRILAQTEDNSRIHPNQSQINTGKVTMNGFSNVFSAPSTVTESMDMENLTNSHENGRKLTKPEQKRTRHQTRRTYGTLEHLAEHLLEKVTLRIRVNAEGLNDFVEVGYNGKYFLAAEYLLAESDDAGSSLFFIMDGVDLRTSPAESVIIRVITTLEDLCTRAVHIFLHLSKWTV